jgi:hypothetical protein
MNCPLGNFLNLALPQLVKQRQKDKWLISLSVLKQLTRCNQEVIARVIEGRKDEIDKHHEKHELGTFHNSKGKFAPKIHDAR